MMTCDENSSYVDTVSQLRLFEFVDVKQAAALLKALSEQ
jgi:hypothetical protein